MQKTPVYIGIFVEDSKVANKQVKNYVREGLTQLLETFSEQQADNSVSYKQICNDLSSFEQVYKLPNDAYHITTLFIGGNEKKLNPKQQNLYKNFKSNIKTTIKIDCIVYVPGYLICGYCSQVKECEVDNKYPHVTLFLGGNAKAVESNSILEALANKYPGMLQKKQFKTGRYECQYQEFKEVFVVNNQIELKAVTGNNFVCGKK